MIHYTFKCLQQDSCVKENFKVQINQVLESVTCNQRPYQQLHYNCLFFDFWCFNQNKLKQTNVKSECFTKYVGRSYNAYKNFPMPRKSN